MSTGLHSKIDILIGGQVIETKEFDDTVENLTIGSDSSANICIDVDGVMQMHAVVTISDGIALLSGLGDEILVNGSTHDPTSPLKDGDEVQLGSATLRWHITDLRAEEVTDPGVQNAQSVASSAAASHLGSDDWEEEESEENEDEDVLAGLVEQIQNNTADSNKPKTKLAAHQIFGTDLIAMKVFEPNKTGVTIGSELATSLPFRRNTSCMGTKSLWFCGMVDVPIY